MLTQVHPVPLTEENLKKYQRETTSNRISLKNTKIRSKSRKSLRSAGDGESIEFYREEALNASLDDQQGCEKETFPEVESVGDSKTKVAQDMSEDKKTNSQPETAANEVERNRKADNSGLTEKEELSEEGNDKLSDNIASNEVQTNPKADNSSLNDKEVLSEEEEGDVLSQKERGSHEHGNENADESEKELDETEQEAEGDEDDNSDQSSDESSSLDSESDVVPAAAKNDDKNTEDTNETGTSTRSSSPLSEDDDEDDDYSVDEDDDETEDEEEAEEADKGEDELTHYSSSLNASVSSIPTLCDDREGSPESPNNSAEESTRENPGQEEDEGERQDQETEASGNVVSEGDEMKVDEEEEKKQDGCEEDPVAGDSPVDKEEERGHTTHPCSRQVSGRSATPRTVEVSEFDDVESSIFDRRELSRRGSSSRNALTSTANSRKSDVSIKNWAGFGERGHVTSNVEDVTELVDCSVKENVRKRLKTRKMRNAKQGKTNMNQIKVLKQQTALQRTRKKIGDVHSIGRPQLARQSSHSSDNLDALNTRQRKITRKKRRPVKQVSFDNSIIENNTKIPTSDSAFFGSRTESRGDGKSSTKPPESERSGRVSSRWTGAETERASSTSTRPVSTVQSPCSTLSTSQCSRQTSLVDEMTTVNYPPAVIYGKKSQLPSMRPRRHGPPKNKPKKSQSASSKVTTKTTSGESSMIRRVLSANKHKVSRLYNILEELQQEVEELKDQNKSLKRVSHRQERQIKKIDEEEASLPILLQRHSAEMRTLKERMRKNQEVLYKKERESKDRDAEIQKLRGQVKNFRALSQDRKLEERAALAKKLENVQDEIATKDKKILDLEKAIALKDKARQREMKDQKDRYKQAKEELKRVQEDFRSLRERLKEKERELDEKNIYHQHIVQKKKKGPNLPALPAGTGSQDIHAPAITAPAVHIEKAPDTKEKRTNVFLTNAASDSGSVVTDEGRDTDEKSEKVSVKHELPVVSKQTRHDEVFQVDGKEDEGRKVRDAEERRRREEEAEQRRRIEEEERRKKEEEEKRREEEHARRLRAEEEQLRKQRDDRERAIKQKEEEDKKRFEEEAEIRRKKDLLLARMRAIDVGNEKPDTVTATGGTSGVPVEDKTKKLPIFLQSDKPVKTEQEPSKPLNAANPDDDILSDTSGGRKKLSASSTHSRYSYDFKQTVENLHHGLPAHAAQEGVKPEAQKSDTKDSLSDDLSFGSYKPTLGRRAAAKRDNKDNLSFGGYNPSFGSQKETTRKNSGLNFGARKKNATEKEQNGVIFGDYNPSFGAAPSKPAASSQPNGDIGGKTSPPRGRRPRAYGGKPASLFDDDLFANEEVKPTGNPLFGDSSVKKDKSPYPWENKVNVTRSKESQDDSLLPRRKHLQSIGKSTEKNVRAVDNALDDIDDEIEEVIL